MVLRKREAYSFMISHLDPRRFPNVQDAIFFSISLLLIAVFTSVDPALSDVIYQEDFEDGIADGFVPEDLAWIVSQGAYYAHVSGSSYTTATTVGNCDWENYIFSCDEMVQGGAHHIVRFRVQDEGNYYELDVVGGSFDEFYLYKTLNGHRSLLKKGDFPSEIGVWHKFRVVAIADRITASFDGYKLVDFKDQSDPFLCGGISLVSYVGGSSSEQLATFDNVLVEDTPGLMVFSFPTEVAISIPATGGEFLFDAELENTTSQAIRAVVRIEAVAPRGAIIPVRQIHDILCPPHGSVTATGLVQKVPAGAPGGEYTYRLLSGPEGGGVISSDSFPFNLVRTLIGGEFFPQGRHAVSWAGRSGSGRPAAAGVYLYVLDVDGETLTGRLTMVK